METKAKEMNESQESVDYKSYPKQFLFDNDLDSDEISITSSTSYTSTSTESLSDQGDFYYLTNSEDEGNESDCEDDFDDVDNDNNVGNGDHDIPRLEHFDSKEDEVYVNAVTLAVPVIKQHRSSSMDERILKGPESQIQRQASFDEGCMLDVPLQKRSSSVDVNLPTDQETSYKAIPHSDDSRWVTLSLFALCCPYKISSGCCLQITVLQLHVLSNLSYVVTTGDHKGFKGPRKSGCLRQVIPYKCCFSYDIVFNIKTTSLH